MAVLTQKATAAILLDQKTIDSQGTVKSKLRRKMIDDLLKQVRKLDLKDLGEALVHLRGYCDRLREALTEQVALIDALDLESDQAAIFTKFLQDMNAQQDRIVTAAGLYKGMLSKANLILKDQGETLDAKLVKWFEKDKFPLDKLASLFTQMERAVEQAIKSSNKE